MSFPHEDPAIAALEEKIGATPAFETWERRTIMDGMVVTYAERFSGSGIFPNPKEAMGCFEISASRNAIMVHRATITCRLQIESFRAALDAAFFKHALLRDRL